MLNPRQKKLNKKTDKMKQIEIEQKKTEEKLQILGWWG